MPTIFSHPAPVLALAVGLGPKVISVRLAAAAVVASLVPDLDVAGFSMGIGYGSALGHRGLSHSLLLALALGCIGALVARPLRASRLTAFLLFLAAGLSHIITDAMTNGGLGVAALWPFDDTRHFLSWRPVKVSPFSPKVLFSEQGIPVLLSELQHIWLPCILFGLLGFIYRAVYGKPQQASTAEKKSSAEPARLICPSRSGKHTGRCPCPSTSKGLRPEGCAVLQRAEAQVAKSGPAA